ncbi:hypothetical protein Echvi_1400 [Echinicola vietnamensis DSM 17526]|uniref:Uncharacterized protein n=1 Tax=Echinicola vietnamensis (strain DSM 17526 / LMG 23754 / KMM 6221) TaxID=926556 RepID=L0FX99_ECHVK|nr:hypothetical protein Echvi_1400 [Echinicola vietnamensis DSM 17526]
MLLIMLSMMLHNAYPHVHHQHGTVETVALEHESHQHTDHRHSHDQDDNEDHKDFFDFLLKSHSHSQHPHQHAPVIELVKVKKNLTDLCYTEEPATICFDRIAENLHRYFLYKSLALAKPYSPSISLRGPPLLG